MNGTHAVIIDRARIAPAWRGLGGVRRLLIGRLLHWVTSRAALVATHPYPIDIPLDERDDAAREAREKSVVQRTWQSLVFEPLRGPVGDAAASERPRGRRQALGDRVRPHL